MKKIILPLAAIVIISCSESQKANEQKTLLYPETKKVDTTDNYVGTSVSDPYRWLEDDNSDETKKWVEAQNKVTFAHLSTIPFRNKIKQRLTELWNYPKYSAPYKKGEWYFTYKNDGLQNQSVLYIQKGIEGEQEVFLDPNKLSADGTVALAGTSVSNDNKYFAYGTASGGSDWNEYHIMDIESGQWLDDHLKWIKFSGVSWQGAGFYYSRYDAPAEGQELSGKNEYHKIYFHKVGDSQSEDRLIYEDKNHPLRNFYAQTTSDERFLIISASEGTSGNMITVKDLIKPQSGFKTIINDFENDHSVIDNIGNRLLVMTNRNAGNQRLVLIDPAKPEEESWKDIVAQKDERLKSANITGGKLLLTYLKDASSRAYIYDINGNPEKEIEFPALGTVGSFGGNKEDTVFFYSFTSFIYPPTIYQYNIPSGTTLLFKETEVKFTPADYETKQIFYTSKDGTDIPMFIIYKKGLELTGNNPTFLYGYGGFDISIEPQFSINNIIFIETGGVYAVANLRGGGEYGEQWHNAGTKLRKQNVFDDFIAATEYLIREKYTSPEKLAIHGRSNGGLLVGACMTQRPELFKVALPAVGVMDMLRFHKFTIGWAWKSDYGSSEDAEEFKYLLGYSPLHNIKEGISYPATLVTTADHDDRVVPAHSYKFIATLQEKHKGSSPVMIRIDTKAGHGSGKPTSMLIEENADIWSFVFYHLGMQY